MELNRVYNEDCLIGMDRIKDKSIDMILCDLPYGITACKWDVIIPFDKLWEQYNRIIKDNGAIVLFGSEPFSSLLRVSNLKMYKYDWIWDKTRGYNFTQANYAPMKQHEIISIFSTGGITFNKKGNVPYYPIKTDSHIIHKSGTPTKSENLNYWNSKALNKEHNGFFPKTILSFKKESKSIHPTQKPVALMEYLIKTYTNENETVLDNCIGSGTTAIACINTNRNFIGFEMDKEYFRLASERIDKHNKEFICDVGLFSSELVQGSLF